MKYCYIIAIVLSSFFTTNSLAASLQYAFYIPSDSFQQNTGNLNDLSTMRPRGNAQKTKIRKRTASPKGSSAVQKKEPAPTSATNSTLPATHNKKAVAMQSKPAIRKKQPYVRKRLTIVSEEDASRPTAATQPSANLHQTPDTSPDTAKEIAEKIKQYKLEDPLTEPVTIEAQAPIPTPIPDIELLKQKSLSELISDLPLPNYSLPQFKQTYALYALELQTLRRTKKFYTNKKMEEALKKANSLRRFEVK